MSIDKKIEEILNRDDSNDLKILKLQNLAFKQFAASPNQRKVINTINNLQK